MAQLRLLGAFTEFGNPGKDGSIRAVIEQLNPAERSRVADYLERGVLVSAVPGYDRDVIDGELLTVTSALRTDGRYVWRSDLAHYVRKYGVGLSADLVRSVMDGAVPPVTLDPDQDGAVTEWLRSHQVH